MFVLNVVEAAPPQKNALAAYVFKLTVGNERLTCTRQN